MRRAYTAVRSAVERGIPADLVDILCTQLDVNESELTLDALIVQDLGGDSLDVIELQIAIEHRYKVSAEDEWIDDETLPSLTVGHIIRDLKQLGAKL